MFCYRTWTDRKRYHVTPAQNAVPACVNGNSVSGIKNVSSVVLEIACCMILVTPLQKNA